MVVVIVFEFRLEGNETVLAAHIDHIVNSPENLSHSAGRMPQALKGVHQNDSRADTASNAFDGFED